MNHTKLNPLLLLLAAVFISSQPVSAQQYELVSSVFSNGGGALSNSSFQLDCAVGEPAIGEASNSSYSLQAGFIPTTATILPPPATWVFTTNTGVSANIAVPAAINPAIGNQPLQADDAVGVFFVRSGSQICAGYSFWTPGQNMAITAWGDNAQTTEKDGFAENELIRYRIWDASAGQEYQATVTYRTGGPNFTANGIYELSALMGVTTNTHSLALAPGWNMISSYIQPSNPNLESMLAPIIPQMVIMKNGRGQVFWPSLGINQIGQWNPRDGYQIFMQSAALLVITGNQIVPEATPISLQAGWNLVAYLRNSPMSIVTALASIADKLVIVKNNAGQVYWPALGINQIGNMLPGQGYLINVSMAATLTYPANSSSNALIAASPAGGDEANFAAALKSSAAANTGANATLLVESADLKNGDEISVWTENRKLAGRGVVQQGKALIIIWGDNEMTKEENEGATTGEALRLEASSAIDNKAKSLSISSLTDGLTNNPMAGELRYQRDAAWIVKATIAKDIPSTFSLAQNYPNPFNPSTLIKYGLPHEAKVKLEVYDVVGQRIAVLVDAKQPAGYHEAVFQNSALPSGIYFYRLQAGEFTQTQKMMLLR